jgi:hydrogenase/urease accessory protein HupE
MLFLTPLFLLATGYLNPRTSDAHVFAPSLYELRETGPGNVAVRWKEPVIKAQGTRLRPVLPADCEGIGKPKVEWIQSAAVATWEAYCREGLIGKTVSVEGIGTSNADVLLRIELSDGRSLRHVLTVTEPSYTIPERESKLDVVTGYIRLGAEHILEGFDHLLFVLGLVLIVGWGRTLLWTVTAFTVGHSITLALAVLGVVNVPQKLTEAGIALSIYFLGIEIIRSFGSDRTLMKRYPWIIAGLFGLLHGLGFAGALSEVGLPQTEIPLALFSFNVGIELGQLLFVAIVIVIWAALKRSPVSWPGFVKYIPAYAIGSMAAFWFFERLWGLIAAYGMLG